MVVLPEADGFCVGQLLLVMVGWMLMTVRLIRLVSHVSCHDDKENMADASQCTWPRETVI